MILSILSFIFFYIVFMGFTYAVLEECYENPLWLGLIVIFWPIALVCAIPYVVVMVFVNWIKSCIEYYREKRNGKN